MKNEEFVLSKEQIEVLAKDIKQRNEDVQKVIAFAHGFVVEKGERVTYEQGSSNTHVVYELTIDKMSIRASFGETMMGGNTLTIWPAISGKTPSDTRLGIEWQVNEDECVVTDIRSLLPSFLAEMELAPGIFSAREENEKNRRENREQLKREKERSDKIIAEAQRLGIKLSEYRNSG
jgi:hypothetical protein